MKPLFTSILLSVFCVACSRNELNSLTGPPATQVNETELSTAGQRLCPAGQRLVERGGGISEGMGYVKMPAVISFVHARGRCALIDALHEGSLINWLSFTFSGGCLKNGFLWTPGREGTSKGIAWVLTPVDGSSDDARIESNAEMPVSHLEKSTGMALFYCKPASFTAEDEDSPSFEDDL